MNFKYKRLYDKAKTPTQEAEFIYAISSAERCFVSPGERRVIKTFLEIEIQSEYFGLLLPRRELYIKQGLNSLPEIILPNEKKELQLVVTNVNIPKAPYMMSDQERVFGEKSRAEVYIGDKIANIILLPITNVSAQEYL